MVSALVESLWISLLLLYFCFEYALLISVQFITNPPLEKNKERPVSVIIAAKNEAENLSQNLVSILNQNYSVFEVIVVNDQSQDSTKMVLISLAERYKHLKIIHVNTDIKSSKKTALDFGIKNAKYEHLVFTDADCKPMTKYWLKTIQTYFSEQQELVLGFSPYQKKPGFLNALIRYETLQTAVNYFGFAKLGLAYMGVGRNLAYTKGLYEKNRGFQSHEHLLSGDDDLFVNQVNSQYQIGLCLNPESFMQSQPKTDFKSWIDQKRRHITAAAHYKFKHKLLLGFQYLTKVLFWVVALPLTFMLSFYSNIDTIYLAILIILLSLKTYLNRKVFKGFSSGDLWFSAYFWEIILICAQFYIFTKNIFSPKKNW